MSHKIEDTLKVFNRKERYWVVRTALGAPSATLSSELCEDLNAQLQLRADPLTPASAWWAIDYHFDWLQAALLLHPNFSEEPVPLTRQDENAKWNIQGQQEDVDLIIAHGRDVVLVEAKAFGSWSNSQLTSKLKRLKALCGDTGQVTVGSLPDAERVRLHFVLMSPNQPRKLSDEVLKEWPQWGMGADGKPLWVRLQVGSPDDQFFKVNRCNIKRESSSNGEYWFPARVQKQS